MARELVGGHRRRLGDLQAAFHADDFKAMLGKLGRTARPDEKSDIAARREKAATEIAAKRASANYKNPHKLTPGPPSLNIFGGALANQRRSRSVDMRAYALIS